MHRLDFCKSWNDMTVVNDTLSSYATLCEDSKFIEKQLHH